MEKHVLSILVENHPGVLTRVSGLFSRRCYNIDSLSVGVTEDPEISRITAVVYGEGAIVEQIKNQLLKLIDVIKIVELMPESSVYRELALIKVSANSETRPEIVGIAEIFRGSIIDISAETLTVEITGNPQKISAFLELVGKDTVREIVRTGLTGLERGVVLAGE